MKKILKISGFFFLLLAMVSCESDDKDPVAVTNGILLREPATGSFVLTPETITDDLVTLQWDRADYGMSSVPVYTIEIAKGGTNFATPITAVSAADVAPNGTYTWKVGYLNTLLNDNGFTPCVASNVDIRVKSTLGVVPSKAIVQYSNTVTISVTPFPTTLPYMTFATDAQDPATAPRVASSGLFSVSDYEGYMWLEPGLYKFHKPDLCGDFTGAAVYGDDGGGGFDTLLENGAGYQVSVAGYYLVRANLTAMTYSVRPTTWNVFGTAKQNFPLLNVPMVYDQATKKWNLNITMGNGYGIKFRSNGNTFLLGKFLPESVNTIAFGGNMLSYVPNTPDLATLPNNELIVPGEKTNPKTLVNYDIALDLSSPRNYTYTITVHQ